jgi:hypothetical protein
LRNIHVCQKCAPPSTCGKLSEPEGTKGSDQDKQDGKAKRESNTKQKNLIHLSTAEIRRLFNLPRRDLQALYQGLRSSVWVRQEQAYARRCHFRVRLRRQSLPISAQLAL